MHDHERPASSSAPTSYGGRSWRSPSRRSGKGSSSSSYGVWTVDEDEAYSDPGTEQDVFEAEFDEGEFEYDISEYEAYDVD
eukprot:10225420-Alexandrium_andersonii.AAC.1